MVKRIDKSYCQIWIYQRHIRPVLLTKKFPPEEKETDRMTSPAALVLILIMVTFTDHVHSQSISEMSRPVGSNMTLMSEVRVTAGMWTFNGEIIVLIYPGGYILTEPWKNRTMFHSNMSSLTINSLQTKDSGEYKLNELNILHVHVKVSVQVPISNVTLWANATNLVEFNDTVVLMCSVSNGTSLTYEWLKDNSSITADGNMQLSDENTTLTIVNVTRYNQGMYRCNVSNAIGSQMSPDVHLNINYGPSNTTIMPMTYTYKMGTNITLYCLTESNPPAMVRWMVDGVYLNQTNSTLQLEKVKQSQSGNYTCIVHNTVTSRFDMARTVIQIMDPVTTEVVNPTGGPAILNEPFALHCNVTGHFDSIQWWRDGQLISADNRTAFSMDNMTLTLDPVQHSDGGHYQCWASNLVSNMTSSHFAVEVNYGPEDVTIMGPNAVKTGDNVTLRCHATSTPPSLFKWYFNGSIVSNMSEYSTPPLTKDMSGKYICKAFNNVTNNNSTASIMISVVDLIQAVHIKAEMNPAIEGDSYNLTCNITGPAEYVYWMKDGEHLHADNRIRFYMNNMTVMFMPLSRHDSGDYHCMAMNAVGNMTSPSHTLLVNYGPEDVTIMGPNAVKTGDNVTLRCHATSTPPSLFKWYFNGSIVSNMSEYSTPPLTKDMSGKYTCKAFNNVTNNNSTTYTMISVVDPIQAVQIEAEMNPAIEDYPYNLTCNITGPAEYVYWMKDGEHLHPDNRIRFYMNNMTVMFMPLSRHDSGDYHCMAMNAVGNMTSPSHTLLVNFGPKTPTTNGKAFAETGDNVSFNCSAMSVPPSNYTWWFNGSNVANASMFTAGPLSLNMSGEYTCMAHNSVTRKNSTSSAVLTVLKAIKSVKIETRETPINNKNFTLICQVDGPYEEIHWLKDNMYLNMNTVSSGHHMLYHTEKNMLKFTPMMLLNDGTYQCVAANKAASYKSEEHMLQVNYGPLKVTISGPSSGAEGASVTLTCSADSRPEPDFVWFFNNQSTPLHNGSAYNFSAKNKGKYICKATNPLTNIVFYQSKTFSITGHASVIHSPFQRDLMLMSVFAFIVPALFH